MRRPGLKAKIRAAIRAREAGKREYQRADELMEEIVAMMKTGEEIKFDPAGRKVRLVDKFAGKTLLWGHGPVRRWELEVLDVD